MNLIQTALRRPIAVIVIIVAIGFGAYLALLQMKRDILPGLGIPTLYVVQPYGGMSPEQMEGYLTFYYEYHFLYLPGIEHVESKNIQGVSMIKLQFHPGTDMASALAATINMANRSMAFMPPGAVPPFVMRFDAGSVPVGYLVFSSTTRTVGELQDLALNRVRPLFATLPGVSAPPPFGSSQRTIVIRVDPERLRAHNMSIDEVVKTISTANKISPSGNAIIKEKYPMVPVNSVVRDIKELESVPIRLGANPPIFVRDIASVKDDTDIQTGYALVDGRRTVYIPVTKRATASTLAVVNQVKGHLDQFRDVSPADVKIEFVFDQSPYVSRAITALTAQGLLGALLAGAMVLLFLRDWRSALVVVVNIPIALLAAVVALWVTGQTINVMTLGGLALAVGILVDLFTVVIENIHTHLARGKPLARAVVDSGREVALPLLISMLTTLAVFIPSFFMVGVVRALFVPLTLAVGFSMLASYLLSRSFLPVLSNWLLQRHHEVTKGQTVFSKLQSHYAKVLNAVMPFRWLMVMAYLGVTVCLIWAVGSRLGTEIFPSVDVGQLELRLRAPTGTNIDVTEKVAINVIDIIKEEVGPENVDITVGFVGVQPPNYPINTIYLWTAGPEEAVLQVQLKRSSPPLSVEELKTRLRLRLAREMPDVRLSFEPADIVSKALSFGSPTAVAVDVSGPNLDANRQFSEKVYKALARIPILRDLHYKQSFDYPTVEVNVDRERAGLLNVSIEQVTNSVVAATSSSRYVVPNYWADPNSGIAYQVQVEVPQKRMSSLEEIKNIPVTYKNGQSMLLRNVATITNNVTAGEYDRYNMQRMVTLQANMVGKDLGLVAKQVTRAIQQLGQPPRGVMVNVRGQISPLQQMLSTLQTGLVISVAVVFLLLAANFQSFKLSVAVVSIVPAVIAGVVLTLWLTGTTLNIQSFLGAIMTVGIAVDMAILLVTFAERSRMTGDAADVAGVEGARSRLRPILMTSLAMLAGMTPMALGLGEGGEQAAALARAVVGGLAAGTLATLIVLPTVFAIVQGRSHRRSASLDPDDRQSAVFAPPSGDQKSQTIMEL